MHAEMPVLMQADPCYLIPQLTTRPVRVLCYRTQMAVDLCTCNKRRIFISLNRHAGMCKKGNCISGHGTYCYGIFSLGVGFMVFSFIDIYK